MVYFSVGAEDGLGSKGKWCLCCLDHSLAWWMYRVVVSKLCFMGRRSRMTSWLHQLDPGQDEFMLARDTQHTCLDSPVYAGWRQHMKWLYVPRLGSMLFACLWWFCQPKVTQMKGEQGREGRNLHVSSCEDNFDITVGLLPVWAANR